MTDHKLFFFFHEVSQIAPYTIQQFHGYLRFQVTNGASPAV